MGVSEVGAARTRRPLLAVVIVAIVVVATVVTVRSGVGGVAVDKAERSPKAERDRALAAQTKAEGVSERCLDALHAVESAGHALRDDTEFRCPGSTGFSPDSEQHWGATCWDSSLCPGGSYVAINPGEIGGSDGLLRHVIAHEICHVNTYARTGEAGSEPAADACAAAAGFPRE